MKNIEIKTIVKEFSQVKIGIEIIGNSAYATCRIDGLSEALNCVINEAEYEAWGSDDNYIYDLILSKLGLEKA
jgi:hypothetical protein